VRRVLERHVTFSFVSDLSRWKDKVAVVTGASSGIGAAIARRLAGAGLRVWLAARYSERVAAVAAELGPQARAIALDVRDESSVAQAFARIAEEAGGLDVLVNNAGLGHQESLLTGSTERWREMLEVNVLGLCVCTREAVHHMRGRPEGHIFHLGSLSGHRIPPGSNVYGATKYAVRALTESLRQELHAEGLPIRVTALSPGYVQTAFHEKLFKSAEASRELYERYRVLDPDDVAAALVHALAAPPHVAIHDVLLRSREQPT